jgi:hypothetical protein
MGKDASLLAQYTCVSRVVQFRRIKCGRPGVAPAIVRISHSWSMIEGTDIAKAIAGQQWTIQNRSKALRIEPIQEVSTSRRAVRSTDENVGRRKVRSCIDYMHVSIGRIESPSCVVLCFFAVVNVLYTSTHAYTRQRR